MNIANSIIALIAPSPAGSHRPADPNALAPSSTVRPGDARSETEQVWDSGKHCPELDGLRGIAILLVTLYRCTKEIDPSLSTGFAWIRRLNEFGERGVDLFFVLSGFLITGILLKTKSRPHYFRNFIVRRALRIFPLYYLSLAIFLFVIPSVIATQSFELPRSNQFYLWTYTSNVYMSWTNAWSFGPLDHFWSLAVEEHFYLIWPAVVFFLSPQGLLRFTLATAIGVGVLRMVCALKPECGLAVDTLTIFRCDALCLGAMLAVVMYQGDRIPQMVWLAKRSLPILALVALGVVLSGKRWLTIPHTLFPLLWVAMMGWVVTQDKSQLAARVLRGKALQWMGKYSYGMYVIQLPLVTLLPLSPVLSSVGWSSETPVGCALYVASMLALICGLAYATFHLLEKRFLNLKRFFP